MESGVSELEVFIEQVKQSAARAMDELPNDNIVNSILKRSRSDISSSDDGTLHSAATTTKNPSMDDEESLVMNCLLSMSNKLPGTDQAEVQAQYWPNYQDGEQTIVFKFDNDEGIVSVPGQYKVVMAQEGTSSATSESNVIMMPESSQNHQFTEVNYVHTPIFDESMTTVVQTFQPMTAARNDSSSSESVDVEVEDSDHIDELRNGPPEIITPTKKPTRRTAVVKRKVKRTKGWLKKVRESTAGTPNAKQKRLVGGKPEALRYNELTELEDNADQVAERFRTGCECVTNCFEGFSAEKVFRHRLNIADLTKAEHDMYLMGVIHSSMQNPEETCRKKERMRMRSTYAYYGKRVCLTAFLYLEHVTLYQMKRLRKHLQNHGVTPRIHGNHGRKPSNTLPLDIYQQATKFVQDFIEQHSLDAGKARNPRACIRLPAEYTKKTLHEAYRRSCEQSLPLGKIMQYSTFTNFFKKQFPHVKFRKVDKVPERKGDEKRSEETDGEDKQRKRIRRRSKLFQPSDVKPEVSLSSAGDQYLSSPYVIVGSEVMFNGDAPLFVRAGCDVKCEEVVESTVLE